MWLMSTPEFHDLHLQFAGIIDKAQREWRSYDYGEGYFYQSNLDVGIRGLRSTEARFEEYELADHLQDRNVFEIGSNCGFLSLKIARCANRITVLEINPYLCEIASAAAIKLDLDEKSEFVSGKFEEYQPDGTFDAVLSFANHTTYDQNTSQDVEAYFAKCRKLLNSDGLFLFESHAPEFEGGSLHRVVEILKQHFEINSSKTSRAGSFLDVGRSFLVCRAR